MTDTDWYTESGRRLTETNNINRRDVRKVRDEAEWGIFQDYQPLKRNQGTEFEHAIRIHDRLGLRSPSALRPIIT